ncbi:tail fiber domain-containing protein [Emticicia agri]|uniref:Tail fiber domain-containing protein n=1 Tax=Emticicia agri TaxID=2492393 RepID=A0A4Q5LWU0_9BACT|nr:tail fiber domain-containing protein [Emticicia agri]RYU93963.1 tail fiber domain-containing protein [Emticicia agri]
MKTTTLLFGSLLLISQLAYAQSVTLATTTANPTKGTVVYNNTTNQLQYWNGSAWIPVTNAASGTGWALNGTHIRNNNTGNVGIGVTNPDNKLQIGSVGSSGISGYHFAVGDSYDAFGILQGYYSSLMNSSTDISLYPRSGSGNVGINTAYPENKLQIGSVGSTGYAGNHIAYGNGSHATGLFQSSSTTIIASTSDIVLRPRASSSGYVGINVPNPVNRLQIGSVGSTGYANYEIAIGNGTHATGFYQASTHMLINSTTKILLFPGGSEAFVGILTSTPRGPLDVGSWTSAAAPYAYFLRNNETGAPVVNSGSTGTAAVSIYAQAGILSTQFIAVSDARIKNIVGISNSAQDLETIKTLQITDYTMKDQLQYGTQSFKKVIAQQVEKVYPQAVSQITDIVPDIYTLAEKVVFNEKSKTLTCSLTKLYNIKVGEKLQFIHPEKGKLKVEVIEVSGNSFTVKDWEHPTDKIFVYGREVNDFRSVDYEALSMLGISAIQQLAKENEELKLQLKQMKSDFSARLEAIEAQLTKTPTGK